MLLQVGRSGIVSRNQLCEFLTPRDEKPNKKVLGNRLRRLEAHDLLQRLPGIRAAPDALYVLTRAGESYLPGAGEYLSHRGVAQHRQNWEHWIEINHIHLAFRKAWRFITWEYESQIRTRSDCGDRPYQKEYDAVITLVGQDDLLSVALEYERTPKSAPRYEQIRQNLESETQIDACLYIVPAPQLKAALSNAFEKAHKPIYIGSYQDFRHDPMEAKVFYPRLSYELPFLEMLQMVEERKRRAA